MTGQLRRVHRGRVVLPQLALPEVDPVRDGQRRRLALIVAQLENRPLLMLDEWAADQDPEFRRKFYFEFLPALHRAGITVVAISHDDRYIDEMDVPIRRLRMDEGRFTELGSVETG